MQAEDLPTRGRVMFDDTDQAMRLRAAAGNDSAAAFLELIMHILHFWDDLVDRDHDLSNQDINTAMWSLLIALPRNSFYRDHFASLNTTLMVAIQNWHIANRFEDQIHSGDVPRESLQAQVAFIIRSTYVDLVTLVATICGGVEHGAEIGAEARLLWHSEGFDGYLNALDKQYQDADALRRDSHVR